MKQGDFTKLAKDYVNRAGYSLTVLRAIGAHVGAFRDGFAVADVGAGTGKLTENLAQLGLSGVAVEPNDAMRAEGIRLLGERAFAWKKGAAEATGLPEASADWILMGSSFHWTDAPGALREFRRVLRPGGFFTALWNPRDLERSELHMRIEAKIKELVPELKRVSSGSAKYTVGIESVLQSTGDFGDLLFMEAPHEVEMDVQRFLGAWRSVNDIQAQAGPERFAGIMQMIEGEVAGLETVTVPYRTRAWTVQAKRLSS